MVSAIRQLAQARGYSMLKLQQECDFHIPRWDQHKPNVYKVKKVADFLGVTVDEILALEARLKNE